MASGATGQGQDAVDAARYRALARCVERIVCRSPIGGKVEGRRKAKDVPAPEMLAILADGLLSDESHARLLSGSPL